jgi:hypothetical protein
VDRTRAEFLLLAEYLWLWIALVVSLITYIPLFFWIWSRGYAQDEERKRTAWIMLL